MVPNSQLLAQDDMRKIHYTIFISNLVQLRVGRECGLEQVLLPAGWEAAPGDPSCGLRAALPRLLAGGLLGVSLAG